MFGLVPIRMVSWLLTLGLIFWVLSGLGFTFWLILVSFLLLRRIIRLLWFWRLVR